MLDGGEIDLAVSVAPVLSARHREAPLFRAGYACLYDGLRLGLPVPLPLGDFLARPHVLVSFDARRGIVDDLLDSQGLKRRVLSATTHFAGVVAMLKAVDAIATIPDHAARVFAAAAGLTLSPPPIAMPPSWCRWSGSRPGRRIPASAGCGRQSRPKRRRRSRRGR